jgi:tetratricopeptide (TPR) repeat protein
VNTIHAPRLRGEAKHDAGTRQLLAVVFVFGLVRLTALAAVPVPQTQTPGEELRAAKLLEAALFARHASDEEWETLAGIYAQLETKYPNDAAIKNGYAEFLWNRGDERQAVDHWLSAEKIEPTNAAVLDHLGGSYLAAGDPRKAAGYFARAVRSSPDDADYHFSYANVAFLFRHELHDSAHPDSESVLTEALQQFSEASRLQPLNAEYARAYAEAFYTVAAPDWEKALAAWQHFFDLTPQKDFALLNLARVYLKLGRNEEARASLERIQGAEYGRLKGQMSRKLDGK